MYFHMYMYILTPVSARGTRFENVRCWASCCTRRKRTCRPSATAPRDRCAPHVFFVLLSRLDFSDTQSHRCSAHACAHACPCVPMRPPMRVWPTTPMRS